MVSVGSQDYENIEHIVIDGNSSDNTLNIINDFSDNLSKMISENDKGIYDAWNKGIDLATGEYVMFLNSDDTFYDETVVTKIVNCIIEHNKPISVYSKLLAYESTSSYQYIDGKETCLDDFLYKMHFCTPSAVIRRDVYDLIGNYSLEYRIASDYDWAIKLFKNFDESKLIFLDEISVYFGLDGVSNSNIELAYNEIDEIIKKHFNAREYNKHKRYVKRLTIKRKMIPIIKKMGLMSIVRRALGKK